MAETTEEIIIKVEAEGAEKTTEQLEDLADSLKKTDKETKKYTKTLGDSASEVKIFGTSLSGLKGGFTQAIATIRNSVKGLKAFRIALAGTGIGLIVIALGSMAVAISKSEKAMDALSDAFDVVKTVIEVLIGVVAQLGDSLLSLFAGDFEESFKKASAAFDNLGTRIKENVELTKDLNKANRALELQITRNSVKIAENNVKIAESKRIADDTTKSIEERIEAGEAAQKLIAENARLQTKNAKEALRIAQEGIASDNETNGVKVKTREQEAELALLRIAELQAEQTEQEKLLEISNKVNALRTQELKEFNEREKTEISLTVTAVEKGEQSKVDAVFAGAKKIGEITKKTQADQKAAAEQDAIDFTNSLDSKLEAVKLFATLFSTVGAALGLDAKNQAIIDANINTALSITKTASTIGLPAAIPFIVVASIIGAAQLAAIAAQPDPTPTTFGSGGLLKGASHANGGVHINAEGGEAVINKRSSLMFRKELSAINVAGGGVPFMRLGGVVPVQGSTQSPFIDLEQALAASRTVLVTSDLHEAEAGIIVNEVLTTL